MQVAPTIEEEALKNVVRNLSLQTSKLPPSLCIWTCRLCQVDMVDDKARKVRKGQLSDDDMWQLRDPAGDETLAK